MTTYTGDTIRIKSRFYDFDNSAFDPVSSSIKLYDADWNTIGTWNEPVKDDTGVYHVDIEVPEDEEPGIFRVGWTAWADLDTKNREKISFNVESFEWSAVSG